MLSQCRSHCSILVQLISHHKHPLSNRHWSQGTMPQLGDLSTADMEHSCIFCSFNSIETQRKLEKRVFIDLTMNSMGLYCSVCGSFSCKTCLDKVIANIPNKLQLHDSWCSYVSAYLMSSTSPPPDFVGSCCELKLQAKASALSSNQRASELQESTRYDGCLYLPEFSLLIDSPIGNGGPVDIHGFAKENQLRDGVMHCVLSHETSRIMHSRNIVANGAGANWRFHHELPLLEITIRLPYEQSPMTVSSMFLFVYIVNYSLSNSLCILTHGLFCLTVHC